jgi:hypothetical protein
MAQKNEDYLEGYVLELTPTDSVLVSPQGIARIKFNGSQVLLSANGAPFAPIWTGGIGALGPGLVPLDPLVPAADRLPYYTGAATAALATLTAQGRAILDDATQADQRTTLGLGTAAVANTGTLAGQVPVRGVGGSLDATNGADTMSINHNSIITDAPGLTIDAANTIQLSTATGTSAVTFDGVDFKVFDGAGQHAISRAGSIEVFDSVSSVVIQGTSQTATAANFSQSYAGSVGFAAGGAIQILAPAVGIVGASSLDLTAPVDLTINGASGNAAEVLTSQGPGLPPVWAPAGAGGGPWSLVETKTLAADASSTFAGLDGDSDKIYWLEGELTLSAGGKIQIAPNAETGNVMEGSVFAITSSGAVPSNTPVTKLFVPGSDVLAGISRVAFWCRIDAESRGATLQQLLTTQAITRFQGPISFLTLTENMGNSLNVSPIANLTSILLQPTAGTMTGQVSLYRLSRT